MKTNKTNLKSRILAVLVSVMLLATCFMSTTASAEAVGPIEQYFTKYLVMDEDANVPNVEFEFSIKPGNGGKVDNQVVYPGVEGAKIPNKAEFNTESDTYNEVQQNDTVVITDEQKYAKADVHVDFSAVVFPAPGLYHYIVTENAAEYTGVTTAAGEYNLYVVVVYDDLTNKNEIRGSILTKNDSEKIVGMTNKYETSFLSLSKTVDGNMGDKNKYFEFTVTINNAIPGTVYDVSLPTTDSDVRNVNIITVPSDANTVEAKFYLKDGQSIVINGIANGSSYTITETSYADDGYTTTVNDTETLEATGTIAKTDVSVTFTNYKQGSVPTGILLETAPYMILGTVVLAGIVVLFVTRRRRSH